MRVIIIMTLNTLFTNFTEILQSMPLGSKYDEINYLYALLNAFINTHESATTETKYHKDTINTLILTKRITIMKR